jgi:hypothetical protein
MAETDDIPTVRATPLGRLRTWWAATCEIRELTRDVDREDALLAAAATHLTPGPWALGLLFRPRSRRRLDAPSSATTEIGPR